MLLAGPTWGQGDVTTLEDRILAVVRSAEEPSGITVIRLKHAKAEELAATLSRIVPAGVTVVPDAPTNSLIILGPAPPPAQPIASD